MSQDFRLGMTPNPNESFRVQNPPGRRSGVSSKSNLEFDFFDKLQKSESKAKSDPALSSSSGNSQVDQVTPSPQVQSTTSPDTSTQKVTMPLKDIPLDATKTATASSSNPQPKASSMSNPSFSQFQKNVQRQSREQRAVGSLLSGMAIALIFSILLVAGLAGYGGWVLSKQIKQQSATLAELEQRVNTRFDNLEGSLKATVADLEAVNGQTQLQKQQIQAILSQLESMKNQMSRDRNSVDSKLKKINNRLYDIEREQARFR